MTEENSELTNELSIGLYLHCKMCLDGETPQDIEAGWTEKGLQVWCRNHECNIINIDFEGQQHPANTTRNFQKPKLVKV